VQQQQQQSGVMSVSEGLCTWVQLQVNHHFRLKICNKNLLYCGMCQVQAILPMDKPGRVSLVGWAKQAEWLVPGMFHNIMVFRICTSGFIQWACVDYTMGICGFCTRVCGFWTMVRYGRWPKKMCPLCHVRGLNRGRKSDMKTIMLKTKSNPQKTEVSKMCWRNNLRTNFHNKFSSLKTGLSNEVHILLMSTRTTKVKWKCQCTNHPLPEKILFHNRLCLPENYCKNVSRLSQIQHPICSKVILARLIILLNFKLAQC
jgi:hypothetical protein